MRMTVEEYEAYLRSKIANDAMKKIGALEMPKPTKRPKYGNKKIIDSDGLRHDSQHEYRCWNELQLREKAGEICNLRRQVPYALVVNGILVCQYIADAVYVDGAATIVIDAKSPATRKLPAYRMKVKLMQAIYGIQIQEI